ncbi:E3 ubiquitin ligase PQT3-like [Musa acuminata AAA Group]|uniref:E3 ubiquitin ligase PQT3-like n=1 Tax=Musa acuminata AAA Group TaxID=214697 RepID=UPI0031DF05F3
MIPTGTSVLICRIPGPKGKSIVVGEPKSAESSEDVSPQSGSSATESSSYKFPDESDSCDFEEAFSAIHNEVVDQPSNQVLSRLDEDRRIKALVDTPAIDWQSQPKEVYYFEGSTGRTWGGRMACGFGDGLLGFKKPPAGYVCHRCKMPGHFIQHCPTNGDPKFDIKKMKPATGIPRSMLLATPDGSYSLPDGVAAVLKPNESVFEKEIEGIPSVCRVSDLPPELNCPLCKKVMKDAVMSSKCCFASFCDQCIRDHIITKSMCICGAKQLVADDLIPNVTLRETINSFLVISSRSSSAGSTDMGSATSKALSPVFSVASMSKQKASSRTIFVVFVHQIVVNVVV